MSKANNIAAALASRLGLILTASGYHTNAGAVVYRGKRQLPEDTPACITLFEGEEDAQSPKGEPYTVIAVQHFYAEGQAVCDPDNPDIAGHALVEDMQRALFTGDSRLDGLLSGPLTYTGRVIQPRMDGQNLVIVQIKLDATYTLTPANP